MTLGVYIPIGRFNCTLNCKLKYFISYHVRKDYHQRPKGYKGCFQLIYKPQMTYIISVTEHSVTEHRYFYIDPFIYQ